MSDLFQNPPTRGPEYVAPAGPYGGAGHSGWPPPPPPGGPGEAASNPWGPAPGEPTPTPTPTPHRRGRAGLAGATAAVLIAGLAGAAIGGGLSHGGTSPVRVADTPSFQSPQGNAVPGQGNTFPGQGSAVPGQGNADSPQASSIAAKVDPGVVDINTKLGYQQAAAAGTGMVLSSSGEVLTNNHVVDGATSITATVVGTGRTYTAKVVGTDPTEDVAVIQLQGASGLKTIKTGDSSKVTQGDSVVAIGNAGGTGGTPSAVTGTVQAIDQSITASDQNGSNPEQLSGLIQTDAPIQPGDSGGPLANTAAQVIGMDTAASAGNSLQSGATVGFAIPISHAVSIADQIKSGQASSTVHIGGRGFLGVEVQSADNSQASNGFGGSGNFSAPSSSGSGAVVAGVASGSPAANAGLQQGDEITSVDGQTVDSPQTLTTVLQNHHPGDKVTIGSTDQSGQNQTATVTLATGPAD